MVFTKHIFFPSNNHKAHVHPLTAKPVLVSFLFCLRQCVLRLQLLQGTHVLFHLCWFSQRAAQNYPFGARLHLHGRQYLYDSITVFEHMICL